MAESVTPKKRGRPPKADKMSGAERAKRFRDKRRGVTIQAAIEMEAARVKSPEETIMLLRAELATKNEALTRMQPMIDSLNKTIEILEEELRRAAQLNAGLSFELRKLQLKLRLLVEK
jgi:hypothetical protein